MRKSAFTAFLLPFALGAFGCQQGGAGAPVGKPAIGKAQGALSLQPNPSSDNDATGVISTFSSTGSLDTDPVSNPFFADLGTNGRTCASCHKVDQGWSISPPQTNALFYDSDGLDPLFRPVDGANRPDAPVGTLDERAAAYSLLLKRGLIRVDMALPAGADFEVASVDDPYGYTTAASARYSFYRRPLPSSGLSFLIDGAAGISHVMWDGRESYVAPTPTNPSPAPLPVLAALRHQALDATLGHAEGRANVPDDDAFQASTGDFLASFQRALFTAQRNGQGIGSTTAQGARGGPQLLAQQQAVDTTQAEWSLFSAWATSGSPYRQAVARGQALFNSVLPGKTANFRCRNCHDDTNVGNRIKGNQFPQINISDLNLVDLNDGVTLVNAGEKDLPVYLVRNKATGATAKVTDLGRAMVTGKFDDVGRFKVPALRGLAARAPYFHNGSRASLTEVVEFYKARFGLDLDGGQVADLAAFLAAL